MLYRIFHLITHKSLLFSKHFPGLQMHYSTSTGNAFLIYKHGAIRLRMTISSSLTTQHYRGNVI